MNVSNNNSKEVTEMSEILTITVNINLGTGEPAVDTSTATVHPAPAVQPARDLTPLDIVKRRVVTAARHETRAWLETGDPRHGTGKAIARHLTRHQWKHLAPALNELIAEGVLVAVSDGKTTRYRVSDRTED